MPIATCGCRVCVLMPVRLAQELTKTRLKLEGAEQMGGGGKEEELEAKLAKVLQALMEEEIRGEQARAREQSALLELSQLRGTPMPKAAHRSFDKNTPNGRWLPAGSEHVPGNFLRQEMDRVVPWCLVSRPPPSAGYRHLR